MTPPPTCTASAKPADFSTARDFRTADTRLAVQDDALVLRQILQGGAHQELALGDQLRAGDGDDLVLVDLADVDDLELRLVRVRCTHSLSLLRGDSDRGAGGRLLGLPPTRAQKSS